MIPRNLTAARSCTQHSPRQVLIRRHPHPQQHILIRFQIEAVVLSNGSPIMDTGTAERIHPQADLRTANGLHVDHISKIRNVIMEIVEPVRRASVKRLFERNPFYIPKVSFEIFVSFRFDPIRDISSSRPAIRRVIFKSPVMGRISRTRNPVSVEMGETACKVPLATEYIAKIEAAGKLGKKRKTMRC